METETLTFYQRYIKPRLQNDPEFLAKHKEYQKKRKAIRYKEDPEFKAKKDARTKAHHIRRYAEDEEHRERKKAMALERYYRLKALKLAVTSS